ncbi:MAG: SLC13 family permease, partial [Verrucomicrobiia bacterium]
LGSLPLFLLIASLALGILLLTELTSNTATAATFLPVVAAIAIKLGLNPLLLLVPTALAANSSYMMPVGTPPNAIVYGSGRIELNDMVKTGLWLNLILVPLITLIVLLLGPMVLDIEFDVLPDWAQQP